jgi:hypothetical protein
MNNCLALPICHGPVRGSWANAQVVEAKANIKATQNARPMIHPPSP